MKSRYKIRLEQDGLRELWIEDHRDDASLAEVLSSHGLPLNTRCGERGLCKGCEVVLVHGTVNTVDGTVSAPATVKACRVCVAGDLTVRVPARSRGEHRPQVAESFEVAVSCAHAPLFPCVPGVSDLAFAVDLGTTTVVVLMVDLVTGDVLARAGGFNGQIRFGDNVLTRIERAWDVTVRSAMQRAVIQETIVPLLVSACEQTGRDISRIAGGTVAGNTTMLHLLAGEDPSGLGVSPFTPRFLDGRWMVLPGVLPAPRELPLFLLPGIAAYLGADITAGILVTGIRYDSSPSLLIDVGTNGEIVLQANGTMSSCATAAGPAFEGCGLGCGTRAREGAVCGLDFAVNPFGLEAQVIGGLPLAQASGLCGSAYLDFLAKGRECGLLGENGRFIVQVWNALPEANRHVVDGIRAVRLTNYANPLWISEVDVALLLQAKAAIGAGIEVLLENAGVCAAELGTVYLAGGFGMHLNVAHAIAAGLLPGIRPDQVRVVGNTSLAGALLALIDRNMVDEMEEIRSRIEVIELNLAPGFEDRYLDHLSLR